MRVARHIGDHLLIQGKQKNAEAELRGSITRFHASMAAANDDNVIFFLQHFLSN